MIWLQHWNTHVWESVLSSLMTQSWPDTAKHRPNTSPIHLTGEKYQEHQPAAQIFAPAAILPAAGSLIPAEGVLPDARDTDSRVDLPSAGACQLGLDPAGVHEITWEVMPLQKHDFEV